MLKIKLEIYHHLQLVVIKQQNHAVVNPIQKDVHGKLHVVMEKHISIQIQQKQLLLELYIIGKIQDVVINYI